jgi:RecB family endonuclease NucS
VHEAGDVIRVYRPASDETLVIVVEEVHEDARHELNDDAMLEHHGAERQMHVLLERSPDMIEPGLVVLERERFTDVGPVDLFCRDTDGRTVVVEVKRVRAVAAHVEQLTRYCERVDLDPAHTPCRGILVAPDIAPQARVMCDARGYTYVAVTFEQLTGQAVPELTLFE